MSATTDPIQAASTGRRSRVRSGASLLVANLADMAFPLGRNIFLAHTLPQEQYGLAISLSVVAAFAELATDIGLQYSAMRDYGTARRDEVMGTIHSIALMRSGLIAVGILVAAPFVAAALDQWHAVWAFLALAVVPLARGFQNLGVKELGRSYEFWPDAVTILTNQIVWTAVSIALALAYRDFSAMLVGIFGGAVSAMAISHFMARRRWRLAWNPEVAHEVNRYGRPLIPNGLANAFSIMGDRLLVGGQLGVGTLALYNNAMGIALIPRGQLLKFLTSMYLPSFVRLQGRPAEIAPIADAWAAWLSMAALFCGIGLFALGGPVIGLLFGQTYLPSQTLMSLIAIDVAVKTLLGFPVPACLAGGQTRFLLLGSVSGAVAVLIAALAIPLHGSLEGFVGVLAGLEFLALIWIVARTLRLHPFTPGLAWFLALFPCAILFALGTAAYFVGDHALWMRVAGCAALAAVCLAVYAAALRMVGVGWREMVGAPRPVTSPSAVTGPSAGDGA